MSDLRRNRAHRGTLALIAVIALIASSCGDDNAGDVATASEAPATEDATTNVTAPNVADGEAGASAADMCGDGLFPQAFAYGIDDGTLRWVSSADSAAYRSVHAVTEDAVYVSVPTPTGAGTVALDPVDGAVLTDAPPAPAIATGPPVLDGFSVSGSQEGPIRGDGGDTGEPWTQPGRWVYDNVWAIDDGAVFAVEPATGPDVPTRLVGYELDTGDVRWEYVGDPDGEGLWPWHAEDGRLYTLWSNVQVRDTATGELIWTTPFPVSSPTSPPTGPGRFAGVAVDGDTVYVGYATEASGGD